MLTSSFPAGPSDETCGYIRDFARSLSPWFEVTVLAPPDRNAEALEADDFRLVRAGSLLPKAINPFQATVDFNTIADCSLVVKLAILISLSGYFWSAFRLALKSDVLCSHWLVPSGLVGAALSRLLGKPHVAIEHSGALHLLQRIGSGRSLARLLTRGSNRIVTVSDDLKSKLVMLCPEAKNKIETVPMGINKVFVNSECAEPAQDLTGKPMILFVGRLTQIKGVDVLLRAAAEIKSAQVIIAGDGERRNDLELLARKLGVNAVFLGRVDRSTRDRLLSRSDAVVIPSRIIEGGRTEGSPVVCLEAMAAGRVVIGSRAGGLAEMIVDGHNGFLFEPGNSGMLASKIKLAMADPATRKRISAAASRTARLYCWSEIGARFSRIIKDSLKENDSIVYDQSYRQASAD